MLFQNFILRELKRDGAGCFVLAISNEAISFRINKASIAFVKEMQQFLNCFVEAEDGQFVSCLNLINKTLDLKFKDAEVLEWASEPNGSIMTRYYPYNASLLYKTLRYCGGSEIKGREKP